LAAEKGTEVFNIRAQHEIEHQHRKTKMFTRVLLMTSGIAWLALVTTLMALNARDHIIAPNFTCLFQTCRYNFYKNNTNRRTFSIDEDVVLREPVRLAAIDRNILNGLQFVAKILEIWFLFIAGTLVHNLSMLFARRQDGLPLQYLDLHEKLAGSVKSLRPSFWRAPLARQGGKRFSRKLYTLLALTVALYATSTLLGPAIAILLLPVRERASIARLQSRQFLRYTLSTNRVWFAPRKTIPEAMLAVNRPPSSAAQTLTR
jgi:hypothetical protein